MNVTTIIAAVALATLSLNVTAANTAPVLIESGDVNIYVYPHTLTVKGSVRKIWVLYDHTKPHRRGFSSSKMMMSYNCANRQTSMGLLVNYTEQMGKGISLSDDGQEPWSDVVPGSISEGELEAVCALKKK